MTSTIQTTVTDLPESRVRVHAEVSAEEVQRRLEQKARAIGRELKIPGFRRGKVPAPVVIRRIGREAVLDQAVRDSLGSWYVDAIDASGIAPVGDPELDLEELPAEGEDLRFTIEIGVRPTAVLGEYRGVEVPRREPAVDEQELEPELEALRERLARLETVSRPARNGDFVVMDYLGKVDGEPFDGGEGRDELLELGSGRLIGGFEEGLEGAVAGEQRDVQVTFPDDYGATALAGRAATFDVTVKEVKRKQLPELDDDFASDAAGFDTLDELREDIRKRLLEADRGEAEDEFREAALDAAAAQATVELPPALVRARAQEMWERVLHSLSHQGISKEIYLQISGKSEEELLDQFTPAAERALRRDAVIAAIVAAETIEPDEAALIEALAPVAEREETSVESLLADLRKAGRLDGVREDLAARQAVELVVSEAKPIAVEQAEAREKLWTPEQQAAGAAGAESSSEKLWTPRG